MTDTDPTHAAASLFVTACERAHVQRVLVIGGSPDARNTLLTLLLKLDIRAIDGHGALTDDRADRLADWADVVILWGEGGLHASVTDRFGSGYRRATVIAVNDLEIAAMLDASTAHLPQSSTGVTQ